MANYLTNEEIYKEWKVWKDTGVITEEFGRQMKLMTDHILTHPNFSGYSRQDKEDMAMDMCEKMIRNLKNMKEKNKRSFFNYLNACCFSAAYTYLRKHYSEINRMRKVVLEEMEKWQ